MAGFALDSNGGVVVQAPQQSSGPQTSIQGGGASFSGMGHAPVAPGGDFNKVASTGMETLDAINKLTKGALDPLIEQEQKRQYFEGMSEVAQGKSIIDIRKEQPAFQRIFGIGATYQGAQAMQVMASMNQSQTDFMAAMPELRTKTPDQMRAYLVDSASKIANTGDAATDAMVQAKLAEQMGPMLNTHMRQHLAYVQEQSMLAYTNQTVSAGDSLQASAGATDGVGGPEQLASARTATQESFLKPDGMEQDAHGRAVVQAATANLQRGNTQWYEELKQSPVWATLPIDARSRLEEQAPVFAQRNALKNPKTQDIFNSREGLEFQLQHGLSGLTTDGLDQVIDSMNTKDRSINGSASLFINNNQRASLHKLLLEGKLRAEKAMEAAGTKQNNFNAGVAVTLEAFNSGKPGRIAGYELAQGSNVEAMNQAYQQQGMSQDPEIAQTFFNKAAAVSREPKLRSPDLEDTFRTQLGPLVTGNGPATPAQAAALSQATMLYHSPNGGAAAVTDYLGADFAPGVISMITSGIDVNSPEQLTQQRELIARGKGAVVTKADRDYATKLVTDADPGWFKRVVPWIGDGALTPFQLNDGNKQALADLIAPKIAEYKKAYNATDKDAAGVVMANTLRNADMVPGAFILHNPAVRGDVSFSAAVNRLAPGMGNQNTSVYQDTMKELIHERLTDKVKAQGGDMSNFKPDDYEVRTGEQLGNGTLALWLSPKDQSLSAGGPVMIRLDAGSSKDDPKGFTARLIRNVGKPKAPTSQPSVDLSLVAGT